MDAKGRVQGDVKRVAAEIDANVRGLLGLPNVLTSLQRLGDISPSIERIADFEGVLTDIARVVPALEQLSDLPKTLDALAQVVPALERLALIGDLLTELAAAIEPLSALSKLVPTLESLERSIGQLELTVGSVSDTLAPLQSTTERVGKVVDRFAARKSK